MFTLEDYPADLFGPIICAMTVNGRYAQHFSSVLLVYANYSEEDNTSHADKRISELRVFRSGSWDNYFR